MGKQKRFLQLLFWAYVLLIFLVIILKFNGSFVDLWHRWQTAQPFRWYNLQLGYTVLRQIQHISSSWARLNLLANTLAFIPIGVLLPLAYPTFRRFWKVFLAGFVMVFLMEGVQLVTGLGTFDVDDILLNVIGISTGYGLMSLASFLWNRHRPQKNHKIVYRANQSSR